MVLCRNQTVYLIVLAAAILFRLGALYEWSTSPLSCYAQIPGLDMKTHMELGAIFARGDGVFALYRLVAALIRNPAGLIWLQCAAGCLTALLTVFIALHLFGKRSLALCGGLIAALYTNAVFYELVTLPETLNTLTALAACAAVLQARKKHFTPFWSLLAGILLALTATGRPAGVPAVLAALIWLGFQLRRRKNICGAASLAAGLLLVWGPVTLYNGLRGWPLPVYGSNLSYAAQVAEKPELTSWNIAGKQEGISLWRIGTSFCRKVPKVFSIREIPDNLNYYFLKEKLGFARFGVPVALLITLAVAGMAVLLRQRDKRGGLLFLWMLALMVIFTAYYPAGRYRLALYPYFSIFAGYWLISLGRPAKTFPILAGVLAAAFQWMITPHPEVIRAADHTAWGMALLLQKAPAAEADRAFYEAVRLSGGAPRETARMLHRLLSANRPHDARKLLREYPGNDPYRCFYDALLDLGDGSTLEARRKLEQMHGTVPPEIRAQYYYFLGESCLRTGAAPQAEQAFRELLKLPLAPDRRRAIEEKIRAIRKK